LSRTSVAITARDITARDAADFGAQRVVTLRIFNGHSHRLGLLAFSEALIVVLALHAAILLRFAGASDPLGTFEASQGPLWLRALVLALVFILALASVGLYQLRQRARYIGVFVRLLIAMAVAHIVLALIFYAAPGLDVGRGVMGLTGGFALIGLALTRFVFLRTVDENFFKRRILVWGAGVRAGSIGKRLRRRTDQRGFRIVGYVRAPGDSGEIPQGPLFRASTGLVRLALRNRIEEIVVAMDDRRSAFPGDELLQCRLRGIQVSDLLTFLERESGRVSFELMHPSWLIFSSGFRCDVLRLGTKRAFDLAVSAAILVAAAPIALLTALAIRLEDGGPVLYRQLRTGQNGRPFRMLKFRSMRVDAEADGRAVWASRNDSRVTRVGALIRKLRIDELPQLVNVLLGQMSLIGPRPERPEFVAQLARTVPFYKERHFVKPGITGWAQVRYGYGASESDTRAKLEYDLYYVKHHSLTLDLMVLLQTVEIVLFRIGAR
jgi:sugar transferase (PEP-CTERM system associated)